MENEILSFEETPKKNYEDIKNNKIFIGCLIKTEYDEKRINIKNSLNPNRIKYKNKTLYGCLFEPNNKFEKLFKDILKYNSLDLYIYNKILKENGFSCEENFAYFKDGLYPVDTSYISDYIENFNYEMFFDENEEVPMYQRIKSVNMFLVGC